MRRNVFGEQYAQPGDTLEDIREASGFLDFECADYFETPDENFGWGGELICEDGKFQFDGFDTKEAMIAWLTEEIGLDPGDITEM